MQALRWCSRIALNQPRNPLFESWHLNILSKGYGFHNSFKNNGAWNGISNKNSGMVPLGRQYQCTISEEDRAAMDKIIELATPKFVNGTWRKPYLSGRKVAMLKKKFTLEGRPWPEIPQRYDIANRVQRPPKPPKGHKNERKGVKMARYRSFCARRLMCF